MPSDFGSVTGVYPALPTTGVKTGSGRTGSQAHSPPRQGIAAVQAALDQIRATLASSANTIEFATDPASGLVVVIVKDALTGAVVQQIPGNALLRLADVLLTKSSDPQPLVDLTA
ncbi:MAG: flagellar protein FlaG [Steroidobacteraceae bacterium]